MNTSMRNMKIGAMAVALLGVFAPGPGHADEQELAALKMPSNWVEAGVIGVSKASPRFGEYNGLYKSGSSFLGNLGARGGDAYGDNGGTMRWSFMGNDIGLTTRSFAGTVADQGLWSLGFKYDELRHNVSVGYQTPYVGSNGGNTWTLPTGFGTVAANTNLMTVGQRSALHDVDVYTSRKNSSINASLQLSRQWEVRFDYNHLDQTGAKLMGFGSSNAVGGLVKPTAEAVSILPAPTNYKTDTVTLALNWAGDKGHASAAYHGSYFRNGYDRILFQTYAGAAAAGNVLQTMSTPPDNDLHQFSLSGGYALLPRTKLVGNLSYSRNVQDKGFAYDAAMMLTPITWSSANALVVNTHADVRLTDQTVRNLTLTGGIKYDLRDNQTASNIYNFNSINTGNTATYPNTPLSLRRLQYELAADYRLNRDHHVRFALGHEDTTRWCNQYAVNAVYVAGTNCVVAKSARIDKLEAGYRVRASDAVNLKFGYALERRVSDFDVNARAAFSAGQGGGPGLNGGDFLGFHSLLDATRTQHVFKGSGSWDVNDRLNLSLGGKFTDDNYDTAYGIQNGNSWSWNLDLGFRYAEAGMFNAFVTQQHMERSMTDRQAAATATGTRILVPNGATWTDKLKSDDITLGLGLKHTGLFGGKVDLTSDLTWSFAKSNYDTQLNYMTTDTNVPPRSCFSSNYLSCGAIPDITVTIAQLRLLGTYQIDKKSKIAVRYTMQRFIGEDPYYNGYQLMYTPTTLMPTNQQIGNGTISVLSASFIHNF